MEEGAPKLKRRREEEEVEDDASDDSAAYAIEHRPVPQQPGRGHFCIEYLCSRTKTRKTVRVPYGRYHDMESALQIARDRRDALIEAARARSCRVAGSAAEGVMHGLRAAMQGCPEMIRSAYLLLIDNVAEAAELSETYSALLTGAPPAIRMDRLRVSTYHGASARGKDFVEAAFSFDSRDAVEWAWEAEETERRWGRRSSDSLPEGVAGHWLSEKKAVCVARVRFPAAEQSPARLAAAHRLVQTDRGFSVGWLRSAMRLGLHRSTTQQVLSFALPVRRVPVIVAWRGSRLALKRKGGSRSDLKHAARTYVPTAQEDSGDLEGILAAVRFGEGGSTSSLLCLLACMLGRSELVGAEGWTGGKVKGTAFLALSRADCG